MLQEQKDRKLFVSTLLLMIIHLVGVAGILSSHQGLFLKLSPINLLLSALLLFINHKEFNQSFFVFCLITFLSGFFIETAGVKTGLIFGEYSYGSTLGPKVFDVPLIIGVNWLLLVYSAGSISDKLKTTIFIKSIIGALMLVSLDLLMEPVANKFDFWSWNNGTIPIQNYIAWFIVSFVLLLLFHKLQFNKTNKLATALYIVQLVFFTLLSIF